MEWIYATRRYGNRDDKRCGLIFADRDHSAGDAQRRGMRCRPSRTASAEEAARPPLCAPLPWCFLYPYTCIMKRTLLALIVLIGFSAPIVFSEGTQELQSTNYIQAELRIATNSNSVSDMQLANGWTIEYSASYDAQSVGVLVANQLAKQGLHDAVILVELVPRGNTTANYYDMKIHLNLWRISIFRSVTS